MSGPRLEWTEVGSVRLEARDDRPGADPALYVIAEGVALVIEGDLDVFASRVARAVFALTGVWPDLAVAR